MNFNMGYLYFIPECCLPGKKQMGMEHLRRKLARFGICEIHKMKEK